MDHPRRVFASLFTVVVWIVLSVSLVTVAATPSYAQQEEPEEDENPIQARTWALQFQINPNFTLGAFEGSTLSVKKHTSATRAWRLGVTLEANLADSDSDEGENTDENNQLIGVNGHYLFYSARKRPVHLYAGPGLRGFYSRASSKDERRGPSGEQIVLSDVTFVDWSVGLTGTLGVEWVAGKSISLLAEYSTAISFSRREFFGDSRRPSMDRTTWRLGSDNVRFGLSVYL